MPWIASGWLDYQEAQREAREAAEANARAQWQRWFAWRPVHLLIEVNESPGYSWADSGNYAWLRWVERRWQNDEWQYRDEVK